MRAFVPGLLLGERKGRHARPEKTRNQRLIDCAAANSRQGPRILTAHESSTRAHRITCCRWFALRISKARSIDAVLAKLDVVHAVRRKQTLQGEKRPEAEVRDGFPTLTSHSGRLTQPERSDDVPLVH